MAKRVLDLAIDDIVKRYTIDLEPMISIAKRYHTSRQAVFYALKRAGIDTSKQANGTCEVSCSYCGKPHKRTRANTRNFLHHYCSKECYYEALEMGRKPGNKYIEYAHGRTEARKIVSCYIELLPGYIVHHEDRNQRNNEVRNLKVFASAGDHLKYHRGFRVPIIWDGTRVRKFKHLHIK